MLPRLAEDPAFGFTAAFQLPADFLRLVDVVPDVRAQVEGGRLLANAGSVAVVYVRREEDVTMYDPQLASVLSLKLAADLAYGVTASTTLAQSLEQLYQQKLREAKGTDAREADPAVALRPSAWVRAKLGS